MRHFPEQGKGSVAHAAYPYYGKMSRGHKLAKYLAVFSISPRSLILLAMVQLAEFDDVTSPSINRSC